MKKLLISFFVGLVVFLSFARYSPALADSTSGETWYNQGFQSWYGKVYDPTNPSEIFGERYTAAQVQWIIYGLFGFLINTVTGPQNTGLIQCFLSNTANITVCADQLSKLVASTNVQNQTVASVPQQKQNLLSLVFATNRPISGIGYVKEKINSFSLVPVTHAQTVGVGFSALQPIQDFWRAFRNFSYGLFVIVAIVFAFMIMFRVKLSPQTVISVQSALPKIIISLILVTFSYAIAGFLIDMMYVVIGIISLIGGQIGFLGLNSTNLFHIMTVGQPWGGNLQLGILTAGAMYSISFIVALFALAFLNIGLIGSVIALPFLPLILVLVIILIVIAIIVSLWIYIKTTWGLLKAFVNILLLTIFAPLQLTLGTLIPNLGFGSWIKSYISNLAVFVVTGALIVLSFIFLAMGWDMGFSKTIITQRLWQTLLGSGPIPNWITGGAGIPAAWPPLLGNGGNAGMGLLFVIASFVVFTMIPKAHDLIQSFMSGKPFAYGSGIGEAFGPIKWAGNQAWNQTGARDTWEMAQIARKGRIIEQNIGSGGRFRRAAETFVGGENAPGAINTIVENYQKKSGRENVH